MFPDKMPGEDFINSWYPIIIALSLGFVFGLRNYMRGAQCRSDLRLKKKTVIVTGANVGIGLEVARELAERGARVILACRDEEKAKLAAEDIEKTSRNKQVVVMKLDLRSFKSIREFADKFNKAEKNLHILVNNAGIMSHPQGKTKNGHEVHFGVNYLGHFLLTQLLLEKMKCSAPARIVTVTALAYQLGEINFDDIHQEQAEEFKSGPAYSQSKLAIVLFTRHLAKLLEGTNVTANVAMPGIVNTDLYRNMPFQKSSFIRLSFTPFLWFLMKGPKDGAQTILQCAVGTEEEGVTGKYYKECVITEMEETAKDDEVAQRLWDLSMKLISDAPEEEAESEEEEGKEKEEEKEKLKEKRKPTEEVEGTEEEGENSQEE